MSQAWLVSPNITTAERGKWTRARFAPPVQPKTVAGFPSAEVKRLLTYLVVPSNCGPLATTPSKPFPSLGR